MQTTYFVSHAGQTYGPWTVVEITSRIGKMELIATDYIYDESSTSWIPLMECKAVIEALRLAKPAAPPTAQPPKAAAPKAEPEIDLVVQTATITPISANSGSDIESEESGEWFVQKDSHRYGPFTYQGLVKALQEKSVFDYDLVWKKGMEKWIRLAEHELFNAEAIRKLQTDAKGIFQQRKHKRLAIKTDVIVHDNKSVWLGQTYQGSEGGSGMHVRNATLMPGQVLFLHFTGFDGIPSFNALCEVVSKKYVPNIRDPRSTVPYGMKFVKLDKQVQEAMRDFFGRKAA
jgi:hypothetical protein